MNTEQLVANHEAIKKAKRRQSKTIGSFAAALAKAQGDMTGAAKDRENPHFKSRYADLASVWDACRKPLSANGIAVIQRVRTDEDVVVCDTMLIHASGEWMGEELRLPVLQPTPQGIGSVITYARRYSLSAMVGVAPDDDDDGEAAMGRAPQSFQRPPQQQRPNGSKTEALKSQLRNGQPPAQTPMEKIQALAKIRGLLNWSTVTTVVKESTGKTKPSELTDEDIGKFLKWCDENGHPDPATQEPPAEASQPSA